MAYNIYGVKTSHKDLKALAEQLGAETMGAEWLEYREKHPHTRIAYSQGAYGVIGELFYIKDTGGFVRW